MGAGNSACRRPRQSSHVAGIWEVSSVVGVLIQPLSWTSIGNADVVVDWNVIAAQTIAAGARPGPSPLFDYAMVHAAMHDAVQAFEERFEPYNAANLRMPPARPMAAAAAAAHGVLVGLYPMQQGILDTIYKQLPRRRQVSQGDPGVAVGEQAAAGHAEASGRVTGAYRADPELFIGRTDARRMASDLLSPDRLR